MKDKVNKQLRVKHPLSIFKLIKGNKYNNNSAIESIEDEITIYKSIIDNDDIIEDEDDKHGLWKDNTPFLYDYILNNCENNYSTDFCIGGFKETKDSKGNYLHVEDIYFTSKDNNSKFNYSTGIWEGNCEVINIGAADMKVPNTTLLTHVGKYTENSKNSGVNINKRIIHPDNIIKMNLGGLISKKLYTLSKSNLIHMWNTESQVSKTVKINAEPNVPNLTLIPREDDLLSSLTVNSYIPRVLSTSNKSVLLWDVEDSEVKSEEKGFFNNSVKYSFLGVKSILSTKLESDIVITKFLPNDKSGSTILGATKGGDLKLWDIRTSYEPMNSLSVIHSSLPELTAVDIEPVNSSLIAVGFSDGIIDVFDLRLFGCNNEEKANLPQKIQLSGDNHKINDLHWSPSSSGYLASSGEDVVIWNTSV